MGRKYAREEAMKLLFQMDMNKDFSMELVENFIGDKDYKDDEIIYIKTSIESIIDKISNIDELIKKNAKGWKINRLAKVDLSILRIAVFEILYRDDIPVEVSINEALEISKKFSSPEASKFINGLLGNLVRGLDE